MNSAICPQLKATRPRLIIWKRWMSRCVRGVVLGAQQRVQTQFSVIAPTLSAGPLEEGASYVDVGIVSASIRLVLASHYCDAMYDQRPLALLGNADSLQQVARSQERPEGRAAPGCLGPSGVAEPDRHWIENRRASWPRQRTSRFHAISPAGSSHAARFVHQG